MTIIPKVIVVVILCVSTTSLFAEKVLTPPKGQSPECLQSYDEAASPKIADNVLGALTSLCLGRGGMRVKHKILSS